MKIILFILGMILTPCLFAYEIQVHAKPGGIYVLPDDLVDTKIIITGSGSEQRPFKLIGAKNRTILSGNSRILCRASNIIIEGLDFKNNLIKYGANNDALLMLGGINDEISNIKVNDLKFEFSISGFLDEDKKSQFYWIRVSASNAEINSCSFEGKRNRLPIIHIDSYKKGNVISNCTFKNVAARKGESLEAIRIGLMKGWSDCKIINNCFYKYNGDAETVSCKADNIYLEGNSFIDCRSGIVIRWGKSCEIRKNVFTNTATAIRLTGKNHQIIENRFSDSAYGDIVFMKGGDSYESVENILIENNTFLLNAKFAVMENNSGDLYPNQITLINNFKQIDQTKRRIEDAILNRSYFKSSKGKMDIRSTGSKSKVFKLP